MKPAPPFSCTYSPNLPELIWQLNCTIAISTYQAGKVVFISAKDENELVQLPRSFPNAMAIGIEGNRLAIASLHEVEVLANSPGLAQKYPKQPETYDNLYVPRAAYYTGTLDIHGLAWGRKGLWAVNTVFSCLSLIDDNYSFIPQWQPSFITKLSSEDRCHLNGMAMQDGEPLWVTALGTGDELKSWRNEITKGGVVIHVPTKEIILRNLPMPHTPRLYDGKLYVLFSATGEIAVVDMQKGTYDVINKIDGFIRGMSRCGDYLFIGQSKIRKKSSAFKDLEIAEKSTWAGFIVLHIPTGSIVAELRYHASVDEIFDIEVLPGLRRPGILNTEKDTYTLALTTPDATFWAAKKEEKL
jgi:uncharacterized protein (TIGR03032 family)